MFSWSDRKPPRVPANLLSLNKIEIDRYSSDIALIEGIWGGIFYYPQFVDYAAGALNLKGCAYFLKSDDNIIAASNLLLQDRKLVRAATIPHLFQYFGPIPVNESFSPKETELIDRYLHATCDFVFISLPPSPGREYVFPHGWHAVRTVTPALRESEMAGWGGGFRDDVKNKIRKARREKIKIEMSESLPEGLWALAYERRGVSVPLPPANLGRWCSGLIADSLLRLYIARSGDVPVAFRGELLQGRFAYDWIAGSNPDYHATGANQLLMAEIGDDLKSRGVTIWDLVGGQIKSIAEFKKSFGASEIHHYHAYKSINVKGRMFELGRKLKNAWRD
jgi:hypothetical protein